MSNSESDEPLLSTQAPPPAAQVAAAPQSPLLLPSSSVQSIPLETMSHHHYVSGGAGSSSGIGSAEDLNQVDPELAGGRPLGLTGLQNLGNTCYMNAGIQALSNCPQLTGFMTDCSSFVRKPGLAKSFQRLIADMWSPRRSPYVVPAGIAQGVKKVCPAFKGYSQHDAQEFLRCLLDQLHEELKVPIVDDKEKDRNPAGEVGDKKKRHRRSLRRTQPVNGHSHVQRQQLNEEDSDDMDLMISSDEADDYETCDSGLSWGRSSTNVDHIMNGHGSHHSLTHSHSHVPHHHKQQSQQQYQPVCASPSNGSDSGTIIPISINNHNSHHPPHPLVADPVVSSSTSSFTPNTAGTAPLPPAGYCDCDDAVSRTASIEPESGIYSMQSLNVNGSNATNGSSIHTMLSRGRSYEDEVGGYSGSLQSIVTQDLLPVDSSPVNGAAAPLAATHATELPSSSGTNCNHHNNITTTTSSSSHNNSSNKKQNTGTSSTTSSSNTKYRSVISDIFDGKILSSVQCLTCDNVSTTKETFQDLSLSIPNREQLNFLRSQRMKHASSNGEFGEGASCSSGRSSPTTSITSTSSTAVQVSDAAMQSYSWIWSWIEWIFSIFWGPTVTLEDCLSAFFSADELKGDNMYSCQKCTKLRNGIKYSRVVDLPDILCIHLKRFRHELMYSSKISSQVTFPLEGLDMAPYVVMQDPGMDQQEHESGAGLQPQLQQQHHFHLQQQSQQSNSEQPSSTKSDQITTYDLVSVICHHGTPASGHYTAYCLNSLTDTWYEFDDQYVTAVDPHQVASCEAYVLFYRKSSDEVNQQRLRIVQLIERSLPDSISEEYFISNQWINRFNTFADPGPITNSDFLCPHLLVQPSLMPHVRDMCSSFSFEIWQYLLNRYGGGPECSSLELCRICLEKESAAAAAAANANAAIVGTSSQAISHPVTVSGVSLSSLLLNNSPF